MIERRLPSALVLVVALVLSAVCTGNLEPAGGVAAAGAPGNDDWHARRLRMVESQLRSRDITDERVLEAMAKVPRHLFVPDDRRDAAYTDRPLPIGYGQTISQPYIVAYMTQALMLDARDRVLEIGTGSAYQAAILAELAGEVYSMEIVEALAVRARATLLALGYSNVQVRTGNGYLGWPERAPFDKIIVTAAPKEVPSALVAQLAENGILVVPVGSPTQVLTVIRKTPGGVEEQRTLPVLFVPMVGKPGGSPH